MKLIKQLCFLASSSLLIQASLVHADQVFLDDLIVGGSACVGLDCNNGESFGFDTLRLKENNLRINFDDTSVSASFPKNDWRIVANDSDNGGLNYLGIEDSTAGRIPFRVEAGARANALYVEADSDVGIGTNNPVVNLHIVDGNTPTLRLEQDGSSGFTPQTWDVAGNEANFFIRDVTNGSKLFFRSEPGAPENSIYIDNTGQVGFGTNNPSEKLDIRSSGNVRFALTATDGDADSWVFNHNAGQDALIINYVDSGTTSEFVLDQSGNLTVSGDVFSTTCPTGTPCAPDYVFEDDYPLMPLGEVKDFIERESHLPHVPSADDLTGPISINQMQMTLLRKVEELTLYTLQQQDRIEQLEKQVAETNK